MRAYGSHVTVNTYHRQLTFHESERPVKTYPVGVGKSSTPTPIGSYKVINKILNPGGALGSRWLGLSIPDGVYGIHGTNNPASIGGYVSNGCIRMHNRDVEELFPLVNVGAPVVITVTAGGTGQPQVAPAGKVHTVRPGETLWQIASLYSRPLDLIIQVNNLTDPDRIYPGQPIIIPN
jgi:LysM repeat protein